MNGNEASQVGVASRFLALPEYPSPISASIFGFFIRESSIPIG